MITNESRPLRVLMVAPRFPPFPKGGLAQHLYQVGRRLTRSGIDLTILATDEDGRLPAFEESEGVQIRRVRTWPANELDYFFAPGIYRVITRGSWDVIHCQGYHTLIAPIAMLAAWRANIPYILTIHSSGDESRLRKALRSVHWILLGPLIARAQKLVAMTQFEVDFFTERWRLPAERFVIIPSGARHLPEVSTLTAGAANGANNSRLILSIGRLVQYKGHQRVIAAMPKVLEHVPDARLRIVGEGPYESALQKMVRKLGVAEHVEIGTVPIPPDDQDGMASLIAQADLVTLLSEHEALGMAVLEALALKRPVLVAGTSALQEFADRGLARAVPLESTPEEVAAAVVDQLRRPLIPLNAELPTWDACVANLLALYQSVARKPHAYPDTFTVLPAH